MKRLHDTELIGVNFNGGKSYRSVLISDNVGFSLMKTCISRGGPYLWHYKNHKEACYCISGEGFILDKSTGKEIFINPGTTYIVDKNQPHEFTAKQDVVQISVFYPGLFGDETHDLEGNYFSKEGHRLVYEKYSKIYDIIAGSMSKYDAIDELIKLNI